MKEITSIPNAVRMFDALRNLGYDLNSSFKAKKSGCSRCAHVCPLEYKGL